MITPSTLAIILQGAPFPGAVFTVTPGGAAIDITADGATITFCEGAWFAAERRTTPAHLSFTATPTAAQVHAEIRRVLSVLAEPSPTWAEIKADCVGPELPRRAATRDEIFEMSLGDVSADRYDAIQDRLTDEMDRRKDVEQMLAKVTAERDAERAHVITLNLHKKEGIEALNAAKAELARLTDAHAVVSQRLAGSQKEVAEVSAERDEATARATKAEARVKRLRKSINAAHDVLDEAAIGLEPEGSPRWTLARRCRAAVAPVWGYLDAMQAFDVVGEIVGVTGKTGERGFIDAVIARVKALRNDDDTRAAIAVAVGLDGSASLGLILDTVKSADTTKDADLLRLVSYHQAPITFNARPLTLAERAAFVIRRLWQGRTNAANEAAALRRELSDIEAALGDLPDTAEREPIGDREEHLGLSTAERIRLSR